MRPHKWRPSESSAHWDSKSITFKWIFSDPSASLGGSSSSEARISLFPLQPVEFPKLIKIPVLSAQNQPNGIKPQRLVTNANWIISDAEALQSALEFNGPTSAARKQTSDPNFSLAERAAASLGLGASEFRSVAVLASVLATQASGSKPLALQPTGRLRAPA